MDNKIKNLLSLMPKFLSHEGEVVHASLIFDVHARSDSDLVHIILCDPLWVPVGLEKALAERLSVKSGRWLISDREGTPSCCSSKQFSEGYSRFEETRNTPEPIWGDSGPGKTVTVEIDLDAADFSDALMWLKEGKKVSRKGWNAGGQYCWMVPGGQYPAGMEAIKGPSGDMVPYGAFFSLKNAQGVVVPWVPSVGDLLATDWHVYNAPVADKPPHQLRVLEELAQLSERLDNLNEFIDGGNSIFANLPHAEQSRLLEQVTYMAGYQDVLIRRVAEFS